MSFLVIWGKASELLAGTPPPGTVEEVETLASLLATIKQRWPAVVLADPARVEKEKKGVEAWLRAGGADQAVIIAVAERGDGDQVLQRLPFVKDVIARPVSPGRQQAKVEHALEALQNAQALRQLEKKLKDKTDELKELNVIGIALTSERDTKKLLDVILEKSRRITGADAGSLYLVERGAEDEETSDDQLRFKLAQNDSIVVPFRERAMRLDETSVAGYVALTGESVNAPDVYRLPPGSPFQVSRAFDEQSGYRTKSMLVVPMRDHEDKVIGVVQLINKKKQPRTVLKPPSVVEEEVIPFTETDEDLAESLASQAAVAYRNAKLLEDIRKLFESFVHASVSVIEQRDEATRGHSDRVAILTVGLAEKVDSTTTGPLASVCFSRDQVREIQYAALLHDFGKVGVKEKVLLKQKKLLGRELDSIRHRFAYLRQVLENQRLRARLERISAGEGSEEALAAIDVACAKRQAEIDALLKAVLVANEPTVVEAESRGSLELIRRQPTRAFASLKEEHDLSIEEWVKGPLLSAREVEALSIRRGSLTELERLEIQTHVEETYRFLSRIPWTREFRRIPEIAYAHHEKLDGSGYPRRLTADAGIPVQSRMMTISDIYDALVAQDRPYKPAVPAERALEILEMDVLDGKLDADLFRVFHEAGIWDDPKFKSLVDKPRRP
jgi:HD-GYP domain-containing protein (c-di-GMP phosphodiesterase class II)